MPTNATAHLYSPIGLMTITGSDVGLHAVRFSEGPDAPTALAAVPACLRPAREQLAAYFGRELRDFDLTCAPVTGTDFQRRVWGALASVGHGRTVSYLHVAKLLGNSRAVRAVGAANGQNPIAIVCPCHRVIGADGSLTGYAGGLVRKRWLLAFEQPQQGGLFG